MRLHLKGAMDNGRHFFVTVFFILLLLFSGVGCVNKDKEAPKKEPPVRTPEDTYVYEEGKITIATLEWPPYGSEHIKNNGILAEALRRVFNHAGYDNVEIHFLPWQRVVTSVKNLRYDIISSVWENSAFEKDFDYFYNLYSGKISFMALKDSPVKTGRFEDLKGLKVGYIRGGGYPDYFLKETAFTKIDIPHAPQALKMLKAKRFDVFCNDPLIAQYHIDRELHDLKGNLKILAPPLITFYGTPAISKGHPHKDEIIHRYNKAFKELMEKGLYDELAEIYNIKITYRKDW